MGVVRLDLELEKARCSGLRAERNELRRVIKKFDDDPAELKLAKVRVLGLRAERNALQRIIQKFDDELADLDDTQREKVRDAVEANDAFIRIETRQIERMEKTVAEYKRQLKELCN